MWSRSPSPLMTCVAFAIVLALAACSPSQTSQSGKTRLSIATGGTGGVYYLYGGALASVIGANLPHVDATAEVTAASVDNLKLMRRHEADLAFTLADTLAEAVAGLGPFTEGGAVPARALAVLYDSYTHIVARAGAGVARVADLRGKIVSVGAAGSGTEILAIRILKAAGLDSTRDIVGQSLGVSQSVDQFKDGKIDAFFWSGGVPTAAVLDLANTPGTLWNLIPNDDVLPALQAFGPGLYARLAIPKEAYPGLPADVGVVGVANLLVVHEQMPEQMAYDITRLLFEKQAQLAVVHPEAARLSLTTATTGSPAPFHPGAIRFYRERGAWKE